MSDLPSVGTAVPFRAAGAAGTPPRRAQAEPGPITRMTRWAGGGQGPWRTGQIVGEVLIVPLLALLGVAVQLVVSGNAARVVAVLVLLAVVCVVRRALPGLALLVVAGVSGLLPGLGVLLPVVGWSAGKRIVPPWRALAFLGVAFALDLAGALYGVHRADDGQGNAVGLFASSLWFLSLVTIPGLTSRYLHQRRSLLAAISAQHHQLVRENSIIARETRMRERQRIARDMHDSLGHHLTLIAVHTGALQLDQGLSEPQREAVGVLREASVTAMRELREVVGLLEDDDGDGGDCTGHSGGAPGVGDIPDLAASSQRAGTAVSYTSTGAPRPLAPAADQAAYRIVQEGLTNAHKHAPGSALAVSLRYEPDVLLVEVVNSACLGGASEEDGPQAVTVSGGRGLDGLAERARAAGGMLHHGPYGTGGFRVAGTLPYDAAATAPDSRGRRAVRDLDRAVGGRPRGCLPFALTVGGLLVALVVTGAVWLVLDIEGSLVDKETYDRVRVGQPERTVREVLPPPSSLADVLDVEHPRPPGAHCLVMFTDEAVNGDGTGDLARFCFRDGKLVQKRAFD